MSDMDKRIKDLRELLEIQGRKGTIDQGDYMVGLYNGMLLGLCTITGEEYNPKDCDESRAPAPEPSGDGLLPCPFCGAEAHLDINPIFGSDNPQEYARIWCANGHGLDALHDKPEDAIAEWNERALLSRPTPEEAGLREALLKIANECDVGEHTDIARAALGRKNRLSEIDELAYYRDSVMLANWFKYGRAESDGMIHYFSRDEMAGMIADTIYAAVLAQPAAPQGERWTSAKEPPKERGKYLCAFAGTGMEVLYWDGEEWYDNQGFRGPIFWMILPRQPDSKEGQG